MARNQDGTFGKGNKFAKKDFTKEMAEHMVSQDMWLIAKVVADLPREEMEQYLAANQGKLSVLSEKVIAKIKKGDMRAIQWFVEMVMGRAPQQIVHKNDGSKVFNLAYKK